MTNNKFFKQIENTQFQADMGNSLNVNGSDVPRGMYNLIVSISGVKLFSKGIKPTRNWRLKDVKWYFGVTGGTAKVLEQLEEYKRIVDEIAHEQKVAQLN